MGIIAWLKSKLTRKNAPQAPEQGEAVPELDNSAVILPALKRRGTVNVAGAFGHVRLVARQSGALTVWNNGRGLSPWKAHLSSVLRGLT